MFGNGTRTRGNVFKLNLIEVMCLITKVYKSWLQHRRFCLIKFDNIVKVSNIFVVGDFPRLLSLLILCVRNVTWLNRRKFHFLVRSLEL